MNKVKKVSALMASIVFATMLSGCAKTDNSQASTAGKENTKKVQPQTQVGNGSALSKSEFYANKDIKNYLDEFKTKAPKWYKLVRNVEIKFGPQNIVKVNTLVEPNTEGKETIKPILPIIQSWAKTNCAAKFDYIEIMDKNGNLLIRQAEKAGGVSKGL